MTEDAKAKAESLGFSYWPGGDAAPADWDGGPVLLRGGSVVRPGEGDNALVWSHPHMSVGYEEIAGDIIGYHKRTPAAATPADTVQIARMTEAEAREWIEGHSYIEAAAKIVHAFRELGLIRPETTAERFTRETGHEVTPAVEAALAWERGK
jgi:hypothetical protein